MSDPKPTTPEYIAKALTPWFGLAPMSADERYAKRDAAQAVWDALLNEGRLQRITSGRYYPYEGGYTGQPVLVVPLLGATRTKDTT